jgi:hypothetical protein
MKDFKINDILNADSSSGAENDLAVETFELMIVEGIDQIKQKLKIRLQFFSGEWYLDTTVGVRYMQDVFVKNPQLSKMQSIFKAVIVETTGVTALTAFSTTYNASTREFEVSFTVETIYGTLTMQETV